jgi:hypothetical protein
LHEFSENSCKRGQLPSESSPIRAGALDTDHGHLTEAGEPGDEATETADGGVERFDAEHAAAGIQRCGDVELEEGVDATGPTQQPRTVIGTHAGSVHPPTSSLPVRERVEAPTAVSVELYRCSGTDEAVDVVLGRGFGRVVITGARTARVAGHLLGRIGVGSAMASPRTGSPIPV